MVICDPGRHCIALHIEAFRGAAQWPLLVVPVRHVVIVDSPWPVPVAMYRNVLNRARLIAPMKMVCHSPTFRLLVLRVCDRLFAQIGFLEPNSERRISVLSPVRIGICVGRVSQKAYRGGGLPPRQAQKKAGALHPRKSVCCFCGGVAPPRAKGKKATARHPHCEARGRKNKFRLWFLRVPTSWTTPRGNPSRRSRPKARFGVRYAAISARTRTL